MTVTEQNILESYDEQGNFDWDYYQYLCDIYSEWESENV